MHGLTVLIVGNNREVVKQLETALGAYDPLQVKRLTSTTEDALALVRAYHPDVLVYDMPLMSSGSTQIIGDIKATHGETRIIAISLYEHEGEAAKSAGADEFVSKTAPRSSLLAAFKRQCLASHSSEAE